MDLPHPPSSVVTIQRKRIILPSQVAYDLAQTIEDGVARPRILGTGRFAKVFAAQQIIAGQPACTVAVKILHDHVDYPAERLFQQELALNREFSTGPTQGVPALVDIINLGTLVLCGCGALYHPDCPRGCGVPLQRVNSRSRPFPTLRCSRCDYELSSEFVPQRGAELYCRAAKPCCTQPGDRHADEGTIINFALREVMVMECLEMSLADFQADSEQRRLLPEPRALDRLLRFFGLLPPGLRLRALEDKVRLLGKVHLMVQIGEAVQWLHSEKKVVHKDLAPDNIMIRHAPCDHSRCASGRHRVASLLDQAANLCTEICVIDFGLSDKEKLTRSWYEEADISLAVTKLPYLSPEARHRRQSIGGMLEFDATLRRFRVPASLDQSPASIRAHDIIADTYDQLHSSDLTIARVEVESSQRFAYFEGVPPKGLSRSLEIVRPLGEAHDVYALGAVFYYILTGRHDQVEQLSNLAGSIQDQPCRLDTASLLRRDNYANRRNGIREPFWRDQLMLLILRAMVRDRPESFVADRTVRGPEPAQQLLLELKQIQHGLVEDVFSERSYPRTARLHRRLVGVILLLVAALVLPRTACQAPPVPSTDGPTVTPTDSATPTQATTPPPSGAPTTPQPTPAPTIAGVPPTSTPTHLYPRRADLQGLAEAITPSMALPEVVEQGMHACRNLAAINEAANKVSIKSPSRADANMWKAARMKLFRSGIDPFNDACKKHDRAAAAASLAVVEQHLAALDDLTRGG